LKKAAVTADIIWRLQLTQTGRDANAPSNFQNSGLSAPAVGAVLCDEGSTQVLSTDIFRDFAQHKKSAA
jgi:hypothetical protein